DWCSIDLVEKIARQYCLIVVGRSWNLKTNPKGIHYLGTKTHDELQAYYRHCDVNILPFIRGQIADFSSPIKNFEAMIHGIPTVIPEAVSYEGVILSSRDHYEFMSNIKKAVKLKKSEEYKKLAIETGKQNTWEKRFEVIQSAINDWLHSGNN